MVVRLIRPTLRDALVALLFSVVLYYEHILHIALKFAFDLCLIWLLT